ncbi:unnamed protein product [Cyprideis torosa]|uniref:phosphoribosylformylglycinamidine synthase n=1 Tax=Cyprideis torosa TaxID=163714 RepID=A0A7R8WCN0_9CRUS|nr:unnamed protein product [Cyprideis torosa]CAG0887542.1 unnamed protein product [Cyprideis torosa]
MQPYYWLSVRSCQVSSEFCTLMMRSCCLMVNGERREWIKPIMFTGGIGAIDSNLVNKLSPEPGMSLVKLGGPPFRIGVGGGSASSVQVQGESARDAALDFGAVQRGDPEMEQRMNRVVRACIERREANPILAIHDQGAGGNGNVLKELCYPVGALVETKNFSLGDPTLTTLELWGAEYQESNAILSDEEGLKTLYGIYCTLRVSSILQIRVKASSDPPADVEKEQLAVDLNLELVLGKMPNKRFELYSSEKCLKTLTLSSSMPVIEVLSRVLRLPSVASKRWLTNKVDRSVTGLVAQQQCVGPFHTPLADVSVVALSHFETVGGATSIGEQPIKMLVNPAAGARMTSAEAMANLCMAEISCIKDVKCSGNWMWAAKLPGEGADLYAACEAMCTLMSQWGVAVDGGKDSLGMAARVADHTVKAPGSLVVSAYAPCPDIQRVLTPDLKGPLKGMETSLVLVKPSSKWRTGGSALAQCFGQIGDEVPDIHDAASFLESFNGIQKALKDGLLLSGHDVSDGGLIVTVCEMAFGGYCGLEVELTKGVAPLDVCFAEEAAWVLEVKTTELERSLATIPHSEYIGVTREWGHQSKIEVCSGGKVLLDVRMVDLLRSWEETSYHLEMQQCQEACADDEFASHAERRKPTWKIPFSEPTVVSRIPAGVTGPLVMVLREEGSNGDREMAAAFALAGFTVCDATTSDLIDGRMSLSGDRLRGLVFPGGFSYADVLGSARGWAASLLFHAKIRTELEAFRHRKNTFSLGVCNGCQLMAQLGWIGSDVQLVSNVSGRFESRFATIKIPEKNKSVLLTGMEGMVFGVWIAHAEGRFLVENSAQHRACVALQYTDDEAIVTERYPFNPNGSASGIAGMCSEDGRHLAIMPHPERCVWNWQLPYNIPANQSWKTSPWLKLFLNAFTWVMDNK